MYISGCQCLDLQIHVVCRWLPVDKPVGRGVSLSDLALVSSLPKKTSGQLIVTLDVHTCPNTVV